MAGNIGSGKSTLALKLRQKLAYKHRAQWEVIRPDPAHNLFFRLLNIDEPSGIDDTEHDYSQFGTGEKTLARRQVEALMQRTFLLETYYRISASLQPTKVFGGRPADYNLPDGVLVEYWPKFSVEVMAKAMGTEDPEEQLQTLLGDCENDLPSGLEHPDAILMVAEDRRTLIERNARRADSRRNERVSETVVNEVEKRNRELLGTYVFKNGNYLEKLLSTVPHDNDLSGQWREPVSRYSPRWLVPLGPGRENLVVLSEGDVDEVVVLHKTYLVWTRQNLEDGVTVEFTVKWQKEIKQPGQGSKSESSAAPANKGKKNKRSGVMSGGAPPQKDRTVGVKIEIKRSTQSGTNDDLSEEIRFDSEGCEVEELRERLSWISGSSEHKGLSEWEVRRMFNEVDYLSQNRRLLQRLEQVVNEKSRSLWIHLLGTGQPAANRDYVDKDYSFSSKSGGPLSDPPVKLVVVRDGVPDGGRSKFGKGMSSDLAQWLRDL